MLQRNIAPPPTADTPQTISTVPKASSAHEVVIEPTRGWISLRFGDLWQYRGLLYFLVWRDVKVRYKQTFLGAAWAILQPTATMVIFSIFMGKLAKIPSDNIPYPLFVFSGLLPWQLFSFALVDSSNSLVANKQLITKVFFPRLIVPAASIITGLVDFAAASLVLVVLMVHYRIGPTIGILFLPVLLVFALTAGLAVGLWLSALNVQYRDVRYTIPFLTQLWLYATPIAYPSSLIPEKWRYVFGLNPMTGVVEGFRWALFGTTPHLGPLLGASVAAVGLLLVGGLIYFRHMEKYFADLV